MEKMTADKILEMIEELSLEEKQKVLDLVFDEYFDGGGGVRFNSVQFSSKKEF